MWRVLSSEPDSSPTRAISTSISGRSSTSSSVSAGFEARHTAFEVGADGLGIEDAGDDINDSVDGQAGAEESGHGIGDLGGGVHACDLAEDREMEADLGEGELAGGGAADDEEAETEESGDDEEGGPPAAEEVGDSDEDACGEGELGAEVGEGLDHLGDEDDHNDGDGDDGEDDDDDGVGESGADLGAHFVGAVIVGAQGIEGALESAGLLAGADGLDEDGGDLGAVFFEAAREGVACGDVGGAGGEDAFHQAVGGLVGDELDDAAHLEAGAEHDGELTCDEGEGLISDPKGLIEVEVEGAALADRGKLFHDGVGTAELINGLVLIIGLNNTGVGRAAEGGWAAPQGAAPRTKFFGTIPRLKKA